MTDAGRPLHRAAVVQPLATEEPLPRRGLCSGAAPLLATAVLGSAVLLGAWRRWQGFGAEADLRFVAAVAARLARGELDFPNDPVGCAVAAGVLSLARRMPASLAPRQASPMCSIAIWATTGETYSTKGSISSEPTVLDLMSYGGILPETINGRCAQLGFLAGLAAELATGKTMPAQVAEFPLAPALAVALVTLATLVPRLRGVAASMDPRSRSRPDAAFSARTELVNGRTAML
eukprot:EG_transcript_20211